MEPIQWNQYKRGEKIFWIYAALDILYFGLNGFGKGGIEILCTVIWQIILLNFIYYGYSWVLYCMMAAGGDHHPLSARRGTVCSCGFAGA